MALFAYFVEFLVGFPQLSNLPIPPLFQFTCIFLSSFYTRCVSTVYGEPILFFLSHCFHTYFEMYIHKIACH